MNQAHQTVDFGKRSQDYACFRPGFPDSFYQRLDAIQPLASTEAVDLATGPGVMALELARRGAQITGIDISDNQISAATEQAKRANLSDRCRFLVSGAESTGLPAATFDWVTAGQCWHWFDEPKALAEADRLLKPGGLLVIAHFSYLASHSEIARLSEELILQHNPGWEMANSSGIYPAQIQAVTDAGFELVEQFCYHHDETFTHESWRGRMRTCNGVGSRNVGPEIVLAYDADLEELLAERFAEPLVVPHRIWSVVARKT